LVLWHIVFGVYYGGGDLKEIREFTEAQTDIKIGDEILVGKFKNRKAVVKGFDKDEHGQPTVITNKGTYTLYRFRIPKLMEEK